MRLGLVLLAIFASVADARPRRPPPDFDEIKELPRCDRAKSWPKLRACLERNGATVTVLHEVDGAKLVAIPDRTSGDSKPMRLYIEVGNEWRMTTYYGVENATSELLGFKRVGAGYRIDQGQLFQTSTTIGTPATSTRLWLRRSLSTVCFSGSTTCRSAITACDGMVDGKAYWSFHGTLHEQDKTLFVVGDNSRAGSQCMPARPTFRAEPVGAVLD